MLVTLSQRRIWQEQHMPARDLFFGKRSVLSNNMYARETLTGTSSERLSPSNFGVQVCWDMSVQMQMRTLWRFAGEPSRMPSVSRALWAACIHSRDGATPPASSTAMASASATREVDIAPLFTGTPLNIRCIQVGLYLPNSDMNLALGLRLAYTTLWHG